MSKTKRTFLKWAGNKTSVVHRLHPYILSHHRLVEPFAGSCAVSLNIDCYKYWLNDLNKDLINCYNFIIGNDSAISKLKELFTPENNTGIRYYELRNLFNRTNNSDEKAILFIWLNRHCFNGLCRYNSKGEFNSPFGYYENPYFPEEEIKMFKQHFRSAKFTNLSYEAVLKNCKKGDLVYCDPPYLPLSKSANFTAYAGNKFGIEEHKELVRHIERTIKKGVDVIISNHHTPVSKNLYRHAAKIELFKVKRLISSKTKSRLPVEELLAVFKHR
jgi:DNA adenine methylase